MKRFFSKIYNSATPSFIFLALPYLVKNYSKLYNSEYYSHYKYALVILVLLFFQVLISVLAITKRRLIAVSVFFLYVSFSIFLYGNDIANLLNELQNSLFGFQKIRGRVIFSFFSLGFLIVMRYLWFEFKGLVSILNYFWILLTLLSLPFISIPRQTSEPIEYLNKYQKFDTKGTNNKPVILIIVDEYASPIELLKVNADSSLFDFSNKLKQRRWIVRDSFYSNERGTIYSLASLFNYNLSSDSTFKKVSEEGLESRFFKRSALADSLAIKGVQVVNNGLFSFGSTKPPTRFYYIPENFTEILLANSIFPIVYTNTSEVKLSGFAADFYPSTEHNIRIFTKLNMLPYSKKTFLYFHLYMPHPPLLYVGEFEARQLNTKNYIDFWRFTNKKVLSLLDMLVRNDGCKVILTGDHGYRSDSSINPHSTFVSFYGFDSTSVNRIQSVQDLGSLINGQFEK